MRQVPSLSNTLSCFINAGEELFLADKAIILRYGHNLETTHTGRQDYVNTI